MCTLQKKGEWGTPSILTGALEGVFTRTRMGGNLRIQVTWLKSQPLSWTQGFPEGAVLPALCTPLHALAC